MLDTDGYLQNVMLIMNWTDKKQTASRVVAALVEGNSIRATSRMTGVARNTVTELLIDSGQRV